MVHILLIQGAGIGASDPLIADIRRQLAPGDTLEAPAMPLADDPAAARWLPAIGTALQQQTQPFVAVGHSLGGSTLLQWLGANPVSPDLRGVVTMAAPFWGESGWQAGEFSLPSGAAGTLAGVTCLLLNGDADEIVPVGHLALYRQALPHVQTRIIAGMDHLWARGGALLLDCLRGYA